MLNRKVFNVCVSGAAGNIAHSFYNALGSGEVFGEGCEFNLRLLELGQKLKELRTLLMEIEDCCFKCIRKVTIHSEPDEAFEDLDFAILMGGASRKPGMERSDLFQSNRRVFQQQGKSLNKVAKKTCKVLVVANPANTNCLIIAKNAPTIPRSNFTCLTRLDYNRAVSQIAIKAECSNSQVKNVIIWGNHSLTQFPDVTYATINGVNVTAKLQKQWIEDEFVSMIQKRGGKILMEKGASSPISAAMAITDHIKDWRLGTAGGIVSMGILLQQQIYEIPKDLCVSLPVECLGNYQVKIVKDLVLNDFQRKKITTTVEQLIRERALIAVQQDEEEVK